MKFIDLKKQLAKIRKTAPTYTPEQIDFIVNEKYVSIPNEEHIVTNPELFARNSQYKKALDIVYKIEAKLDKEGLPKRKNYLEKTRSKRRQY